MQAMQHAHGCGCQVLRTMRQSSCLSRIFCYPQEPLFLHATNIHRRLAQRVCASVRSVVRDAPFHKDSDVVVKRLEAPRTPGLYWQALQAVLNRNRYGAKYGNLQVQRIWEFLQPIGLNNEKAKRNMERPGIVFRLKQDMSDAMVLKVEKTPTPPYVNGKLLPVFGEAQSRTLVRDEVKANHS